MMILNGKLLLDRLFIQLQPVYIIHLVAIFLENNFFSDRYFETFSPRPTENDKKAQLIKVNMMVLTTIDLII